MTDRANKGCFKFFSCLFQRLLGMQKIVPLIAGLFSALSVFSQKKLPNPTIGKNEIEISSFMLSDNKLAFGGEFIYRLSLKGKLKIGAGGLYGPDFQNDFSSEYLSGYGAAFADVVLFTGRREKWSFGGQLGQGIHHSYHGYDAGLKAGIYYSLSCNYRAIVSKKLLFNTSLITGRRNFHFEGGWTPGNSGFIGLRFGIVF